MPMKKMQVSDCLLMNIDFKLVKGSHETEKDIVDKSNNEANGIESGTVPRTNIQSTVWSKGQIERQTDGQTLEPVALLVPGQEGSNKRPPSPTADLEFQALTPPSKKRLSLNVQVTIMGPEKQKFCTLNCEYFLICLFKHLFWVLKRTISLRWFF